MFRSRPEKVMEPFISAVTEYEAATNTSVSGNQKNWAHEIFRQLGVAVRELRMLTLAHLIRATRRELRARGYLDVREGPFVFLCPFCTDAEVTEYCQ